MLPIALRRNTVTHLCALCILLLCLLALPAWGSATLYRGADPLGSITTTTGPSGECVCIEEVGTLLGFKATRSGDELQLSRSDTILRVVMNAGAAWRDIYLVPLKGTPFERNGRCWVDTASAISLFQHAAGSGTRNRLRFSVSGQSSPVATPDPAPVSPVTSVATPAATPAPVIPPAPAPVASDFIELPEPAPIMPVVSQPQTTPVPAAAAKPVITPAPKVPSNARAQPKYETFQPDVPQTRTVYPSLNGGEIQRLRWSTTGNKIRAVVDASDGADPVVQFKNGVIHALFRSAPQSLEGIPSPYENIKAELKSASGGVELVFSSRSTRIEKMVLDSPRRIVFDFFFPSGTRILASKNSAPASSTVTLPVPSSSSSQSSSTISPAVSPAKPQPTAPVKVTTPTPTPARPVAPVQTVPRGTGRKIVVVDPGHGGKDPGTSGNGITEKNINLAIGLELEKILKSKGFNVVMTRRTDVYLQLQERTDIANKANADVFVSVHVNALPSSKTASGFEIYIMALPTDKDAMNLAKIENREYVEGHGGENATSDRRTEMLLQILGDMQQNNKISESTDFAEVLFTAGKQNGIPMRRVAQAPFFVLRGAAMPAVLLETGFATNAAEAKLLAHAPYQQRIAQAMATGIANYLK